MMTDPTGRILEPEPDADRMRRALADAQTDLQRHAIALSKLQGELMASRLEVSGARGETVQFQGFFNHSEAAAVAARANVAELRGHIASRDAEVERLHAEITALRASLSWRVSAPVRVLGRLVQRRPRLATPGVPAPPPGQVDPNAPYIFRALAAPAQAQGTVTLDQLYHLSRML